MGSAYIGEKRYCHGDFDKPPSCYELAQWGVLVDPEFMTDLLKKLNELRADR